MLRLLTRAIPALIVAAWLAPSVATIAVGFHLWADHHGALHSHAADGLETELHEADAHQHQLVIDTDEAVRLTRAQVTSGPGYALDSPLPGMAAPKASETSAFLEGSSRYGPAPPRYLSHCAFLL